MLLVLLFATAVAMPRRLSAQCEQLQGSMVSNSDSQCAAAVDEIASGTRSIAAFEAEFGLDGCTINWSAWSVSTCAEYESDLMSLCEDMVAGDCPSLGGAPAPAPEPAPTRVDSGGSGKKMRVEVFTDSKCTESSSAALEVEVDKCMATADGGAQKYTHNDGESTVGLETYSSSDCDPSTLNALSRLMRIPLDTCFNAGGASMRITIVGLSTGALVAIIVAPIAAVIVIMTGVLIWWFRKKKLAAAASGVQMTGPSV